MVKRCSEHMERNSNSDHYSSSAYTNCDYIGVSKDAGVDHETIKHDREWFGSFHSHYAYVWRNIMKFYKDDNGAVSLAGLIVAVVIAIIAVVVFGILAGSVAPTAVTSMANTTAFGSNCGQFGNTSCFGSWSSGSQNTWNAIPTVTIIALLLIPIVIILVLAKMLE